MLLLKYLNEKEKYQISFNSISQSVVQITGDFPIKTYGFTLSRVDKEEILGDYSDYTTIYREIEGGAQFSNDGSTWVEPEPIPDIELPDFDSADNNYAPPLSNQELIEAVADLMYEVSCLQLGL